MNVCAKDELGNVIAAEIKKEADRIIIRIPENKIDNNAQELYIESDEFYAKAGEEGFYLCGRDFSKYSSFLTYFKKRDDFLVTLEKQLLGVFGIKTQRSTYLGVVSGMKYDYSFRISKNKDVYSLGIYYNLKEVDIYEDIIIELFFAPQNATYIDMAKIYRRYMLKEGGCLAIKEREKEQETLDYLKDSVEIRIRLGWKPAPPRVLEQTEENEPEMYVAATFDDVKSFVKRLKESGVKKAQICLVGWNKSGHDGRWPDAFPVEERLGGEGKLRELIDFTKRMGYKITAHTNSTDCYSISKYFNNKEVVAKTKAGEDDKDEFAWSGGVMYHLCPEKAWEIAKEILPRVLKLGFCGAHYIDVISVITGRNCFDKNHPCNSRKTAEYWKKIALLSKELFGGFSSEGCFDHAASYLDYGLYTKFNRKREICMDEGINFWEIVFHGIVMANDSTTTVNYPIKSPEQRVLMAEFNSRPVFYIYSSFMSNGNNWMGNDDLKIGTKEELERTVAVIKKGYDEYQKLSFLQTEFIEDYKILAQGVSQVLYSDGTKVIANYNDADFSIGDIVVGAKDYIIKKG